MKKYSGHILIVDDDDHVVLTSKMILKNYFENIEGLSSPKTLETKLKELDIDVVLLDMNFKAGITSGNEGIFWMNRIKQLSPHTQVVLQTAYSDIELAVKSIKEGAVDFLSKPWDKEKLISTLINAYQQAQARKKNSKSQRKTAGSAHHGNSVFIASAASMQRIVQTIQQVAPTDANVLLLGENGTGKEVVAREIHYTSNRKNGPFVSVDLGAIPVSLFESEMFGHEKGAFTDAREERIGKFELANGGTIFLDEIGNLSLDLQVKLLSVLQNRAISRVGSNTRIPLNVRVISATNAPIHELTRHASFREDLFYRIKTVEIQLPPLRDRKEDIPLLLQHYLSEFCARYGKSVEIPQSLSDVLIQYHWPGNIRELQHAVERAVILSQQFLLTQDNFQLFPGKEKEKVIPSTLNLSEVEKGVIQEALKKWNGNLTKAAEELGIGRTTLYRKIEEYRLIEYSTR